MDVPKRDFEKLSETYEKYFLYIKPELAKEISGKIIGYYLFKGSDFANILDKVVSFSELLHLAHSSVLADENLFAKLPKWGTTEKKEGSSFLDYTAYGGDNAPYVWAHMKGMKSWEAFDYLLEKAHVVTTPGAGFGPSGEGFLRFSAFGHKEQTMEAAARLEKVLRK